MSYMGYTGRNCGLRAFVGVGSAFAALLRRGAESGLFCLLLAGVGGGSLAWGAGVLLAATSSKRDRAVSIGLGSIVLVATVLWVRPVLSFGFGFHLLAGAALVLFGWLLPDAFNDIVLKIFGVTSCLYVIPDIYSDTIARSHLRSDARMLAEMTHIPTVIWGGLWILIALAVCGSLLVATCRRTPGTPAP